MPLRRLVATTRNRFSITPPETVPVSARQIGAIPYAMVGGTPVFLLVTSRRTGRWIFPKGGLVGGREPWESALLEAQEEAGVDGVIEHRPIGSYRTWKTRGLRRFVISVEMYPLHVERQSDEWRETGQRHRHWATVPEARRLLLDRPLFHLVDILARRLRIASAQEPAARRIAV